MENRRKGMETVNNVQVFSNDRFHIRTVEDNGEVWFVAKDVCDVLELSNPTVALEILDDDERAKFNLGRSPIHGGGGETNIISEPGLYALVMKSRKPEAKQFSRWIRHDVIPSIRRHGAYLTPKMQEELIANPDFIIRLAQELKAERAKAQALTEQVAAQSQQIAELQPKASYYDVILACKDLLAITTIAKDYGWSGQKMNGWLKAQGIQFKQGDIWLLYQKYAEMGYTSTKTSFYLGNEGETHSKVHTYWTQKGRLFIYELMKAAGNFPLMEKGE